MRRRALLASLGVATLSGCSGLLAERGDTTQTTERDTTTTTTEVTETTTETTETDDEGGDGEEREWPPSASIVDLQTGPRTLALAPLQYRSNDGAEVTVEFAATATADRPATVRATLTNANDYENTFRLNETPPFNEVPSARLRDRSDLTYESTWYLVPTANHDLVEDDPDFGRGPEGYWRLVGNPGPEPPRTVRLNPDETVEGEYVLLGHAEGSGRPTGSYEFRGYDDTDLTITAWETGAPGPKDASRFEGASPPSLSPESDDSGGTKWYHDAGPETPVYLEPSTERARTPAKIDFTFRNFAREPAKGNPYHWVLYKFHDGEWFHVAPWGWPAPMGSVRPGGTEDWTLYAFGEDGVRVEGGSTVGFLGGGRYAFEVGMSLGKNSHAATFELVGEASTVEPMPGAESSRDGATVTVDAPDPDRDQRSGALRLTRTDAADERLISEQVMQRRFRALRNGLPFFESGVEEVVVETTENAAQRVTGYDADVRRFRFDGRAYEARYEAGPDE
jgi:hypothetical protein